MYGEALALGSSVGVLPVPLEFDLIEVTWRQFPFQSLDTTGFAG
jgi:hypothetical protein